MKLHCGEKMNNLFKGLGYLLLGGLAIKAGQGMAGGANIRVTTFNLLEPADQSLVAVYIMKQWVSSHKMEEEALGQSLNISLANSNPKTIDLSGIGLPADVFSASSKINAVPITGAMLSQITGLSTGKLRGMLTRLKDGRMNSDELESKIQQAITAKVSSNLPKEQQLRAQYNSIFGSSMPTSQSVSGTTGNLGNFLSGTTTDSMPTSQSVSGTTGNLGNFLSGAQADSMPTSRSVSGTTGNLGNFLSGTTADSMPTSQSASGTTGDLSFSTIPTFEEFSKNPSKYRK